MKLDQYARLGYFWVLPGFLILASCQPPAPGPELTDGCYYAGNQPVIKIVGDEGQILIPGNLNSVRVSRSRDRNTSMAAFSPGFFIETESRMRVIRQNQFPKYYYMISPFSRVPTILIPTESKELVQIRLGSNC